MIKIILAISTIILSTLMTVSAQSSGIKEIRKEVRAIEKGLSKYDKKVKDVEGLSLEGAEATYYLSGKGLKKITAKMYGETYRADAEFYYSGEELIFAFVKEHRYDTQVGMNPPPKVVKTEERKYYFAGGKLISLVSGKTEIKPDAKDFDDMSKNILEMSEKLKSAYTQDLSKTD